MELDSRIVVASVALKEAKEQYNRILVETQQSCEHKFVVEVPYRIDSFGGYFTPFRVCLTCGLDEDECYSSYKTLKPKRVFNVSRDEGYQLRKPPLFIA